MNIISEVKFISDSDIKFLKKACKLFKINSTIYIK